MSTQQEKADRFRALHQQDHAFIIPNPWDVGTARLLAGLGFEALASTSAGYAFSLGLRDGAVGRDQMMLHLAELASATDLPVSADLENGFGDDPREAALTISRAGAAGMVGGSIEDSTGRPDDPIYPLALAVERIRAAVAAARALPFAFTLTARAENYLHGRPDLKDTIARLQAYQEAGADVLYAPGLKTAQDIAAVVNAVDRPVNVLAGLQGMDLTLEALSRLGVKRVSIGGSLARAAFGAMLRAGHEMRDHGTFGFTQGAVSHADISALFRP
ncbi:MAG: isocitrate lyase/PEP mutase family protein [Rhodoferax sp.]